MGTSHVHVAWRDSPSGWTNCRFPMPSAVAWPSMHMASNARRRTSHNRVQIEVLLTGGIPGDGVPCGVTFPDPAAVAVEIAGTKYVSLAALIEMKTASGMSLATRMKDLADVLALIRELRLDERFGDALHPHVRARYAELWRLAQMRDPQQD